MSEFGEEKSVNLFQYHPRNTDDVKHISMEVPERKFRPGVSINCSVMKTPRGLLIINVVHRKFPDTELQLQLCPNLDHFSSEEICVFISQISPKNKYIHPQYCQKLAVKLYDDISKTPEVIPFLNITRKGFN